MVSVQAKRWFREDLSYSIDRKQPSQSDTELRFVELSKNFFRRRQSLLAGHMLRCCSEIFPWRAPRYPSGESVLSSSPRPA